MSRILFTILASILAALLLACDGGGVDATPVKISAIELHQAFMSDAKAADERFSRRMLLITGEVGIAKARTSGWTMQGEMQVPAQVYLKTELDDSLSDIKYVVCDGDFDLPQGGGGFILDPRIVTNEPLTVECQPQRLNWSAPGLYLTDCRTADP